jgi:hypothetical protein
LQPRRRSHAVGVERVHDLGRLLINAGNFGADWRVWMCSGGVEEVGEQGVVAFSHHSRSLVPTRSNKRLAVSLPTNNTTHHPASTDISTVKLASPPPVMPFKDTSTHQSASVKSTLYLLNFGASNVSLRGLRGLLSAGVPHLCDLRNEVNQ